MDGRSNSLESNIIHLLVIRLRTIGIGGLGIIHRNLGVHSLNLDIHGLNLNIHGSHLVFVIFFLG